MLTHGSLFSGIGGFELGAKRAGIKTLWNCEIEEFNRKILKQHFPESKQYGDIRELENPEYVDIISGGFPCQDISIANAKAIGIKGKRSSLWGEMFRVFGGVDQSTDFLRIAQCSLFGDSEQCLTTFPKSGIMQNGNVYRGKSLEWQTREKGYTYLPTPNATDGHFGFILSSRKRLEKYRREHQDRLAYILRLKNLSVSQIVTIYELVMTFPIGWTELRLSATQ